MKNCESVKEMKALIRKLNERIKQFNENELERDQVRNNTLFDALQTKNRLLCYDMLLDTLRIAQQVAHMYNINNIGLDSYMSVTLNSEVGSFEDIYREQIK